MSKPLDGVFPPVPTFFASPTEDLDLDTFTQHLHRLLGTPIAGVVVMGTNGEAVHLSHDERRLLIRTAKKILGSYPRPLTLIAGCGAASTRETLQLCKEAAEEGADFVLVLPPSYFKGRMTAKALERHYQVVADSSPVPVIIYNMPAATAGLDLDAGFICSLAAHDNIVGLKDSSGNIAKLNRIFGEVGSSSFHLLAGSASFFLPALCVGAVGCVPALANVYPDPVCRVHALFKEGKLEEARALQARLVEPNAMVTTTYSVPGLKAAMEMVLGYGGVPRSPMVPLEGEELRKLAKIIAECNL
ncbi:uncharacterized protein VTP21DRAFT_3449 [Calcarisporiella thermophila]|uniref:uncharacterized protein n=1 Tax=Calcarisporiella thermophila TaxID=911321 RepID=UPI003744B09A